MFEISPGKELFFNPVGKWLHLICARVLFKLLEDISDLDCKYPGTEELAELYDRVYEMIQEENPSKQ